MGPVHDENRASSDHLKAARPYRPGHAVDKAQVGFAAGIHPVEGDAPLGGTGEGGGGQDLPVLEGAVGERPLLEHIEAGAHPFGQPGLFGGICFTDLSVRRY